MFLVAQMLVAHWAAGGEHPPAAPDLTRFPAAFDQWQLLSEDPVDPEVQAQLHADRLLSRTYMRAGQADVVSLFVAWFQSQRAGASQPHSPKVCLPGSGWIPESTGETRLATALGAITVNRYWIRKGSDRALVIYWYQTPRRVIAGEWEAKFRLISDALQDRRTDTALVRVVAPIRNQDEAAAMGDAFARSLYPLLRASLP